MRSPTRHWRRLSDAIWSDIPAAQVTAYRLLQGLKSVSWARELLDMAYLEPETLAWAEEGLSDKGSTVEHRDSNGLLLSAVRGISLILCQFVKRSGSRAAPSTKAI